MESGETLSRFKLEIAADINATAVDKLAHMLKLPDRLSIAEAVRLGGQKAMKPGGNKDGR